MPFGSPGGYGRFPAGPQAVAGRASLVAIPPMQLLFPNADPHQQVCPRGAGGLLNTEDFDGQAGLRFRGESSS
jgi:hypothetical protein